MNKVIGGYKYLTDSWVFWVFMMVVISWGLIIQVAKGYAHWEDYLDIFGLFCAGVNGMIAVSKRKRERENDKCPY